MRVFVRRLGKSVAWLVGVVVGLGALAVLLVQLRPVRMVIRDRIVQPVRGSLQGELEIDDMRWPRFDRLELTGLPLLRPLRSEQCNEVLSPDPPASDALPRGSYDRDPANLMLERSNARARNEKRG